MTPKEYAKHFWDLQVYLLQPKGQTYPAVIVNPAVTLYLAEKSYDGFMTGVANAMHSMFQEDHGIWYRTRVASYRLGPSGEDKNEDGKVNWDKKDGKSDILYQNNLNSAVNGKTKFKVFVRRLDGVFETKLIEQYKDISYAATAPFSGKGFPEEVQVCLQLRYRFQKSTLTMAQFTSGSAIGLDCNGFVGGFLRRRTDLSGWYRIKDGFGPNTTITELMGKPAEWLKSLADLKPPGTQSLILGRCNPANGAIVEHQGGEIGHIMITEPNTMKTDAGKTVFEVVESTGGLGLVASEYRVEAMPKPGIFNVWRGSKKEYMTVRIRQA